MAKSSARYRRCGFILARIFLVDLTQEQAFAHANDVLKNAVGGISDIIHIPGLVNVDFEDVKTVMSEPGKAMMGTATGSGPDRATKAADAAVACPLLEGIDLSGARGVLVLIAASKATFKLAESRNAMNTIRRYASDDAHVIFGTAYDESLGDQLRVTVIATGLSSTRKATDAGAATDAGPAHRHRQHADVERHDGFGRSAADEHQRPGSAAAQLRRAEHPQRVAQRAFAGGGQGGRPGQQRYGRHRHSGISAQAGGLNGKC